jgi:His/Glu/Gln/Arg/opine family amino acid ABC transporter permease subunit
VWQTWISSLSEGLQLTLELTLVISALTIALSLVIAATSTSEIRLVAHLGRLYTDVIRSVPLLPALIFVYYGLGGQLKDWGINTFWLVVVVFVVSESSYLGEVYRAIFETVAAGQLEAAKSLGLSWLKTNIRIVIPTSVPALLPVTVNGMVLILKDTSLASMVTLPELTLTATTTVSESFQPLPVYLILAGFYLVIVLPVTGLSSFLERRMQLPSRRDRDGNSATAVPILAAVALDEAEPAGVIQ